MPTIAQTMKEKRLISELFSDEDTRSKKQRVRFDDHVEVLTEDDDELDDTEEDDDDEEEVDFVLSIGEDGDLDYTIITTTATASAAAAASTSYQPSQEDIKKPSSSPPNQDNHHAKITRPASPFAGSDRRLCEELYIPPSSSSENGSGDCCPCCEGVLNMMTLPSINSNYPPSRSSLTSWQSSLGNNLKIFIPSSSSSSSSDEDDHMATGAKSPPCDAALLTPLITPPPTPRRDGSSSDGVMTADETVICEWPCNLTVDNAITSALELPL